MNNLNKIINYMKINTNKITASLVFKIALWLTVFFIGYIYFLAFIHGANEIVGKDDFKQITLTISQLAATCSFAFVVYQYKINESKNFDTTLTEEAKKIIERMIEQITLLKVGKDSEIENFNQFISRMSNYGQDFDSFYHEIRSSALKRILRTYWQDMYFNHLMIKTQKMKALDLIRSVVNTSDPTLIDTVNYIRMEAYEKSMGTHDIYQKYTYDLSILSGFKNHVLMDFSSKINDASSFRDYFLVENKINPYLVGSMNIIDEKIIFPMLSAIVDVHNSIHMNAEKSGA
ncbi:hypothetical protein ACB265_06400 [Aeromonas dhakensis]